MQLPELLTLQQSAQILHDACPRPEGWNDLAAAALRQELNELMVELQRVERVVWVTIAVERMLGV